MIAARVPSSGGGPYLVGCFKYAFYIRTVSDGLLRIYIYIYIYLFNIRVVSDGIYL
jgi:hypothetical protein